MLEIEVIQEQQLPGAKKGKSVALASYREPKDQAVSYLSREELRKILGVSDASYRLAWLLCYETASRISEALEIRFDDLDLETSRLKIPTLKQRSKTFRLIKISDTLKALILQAQLTDKHPKNGYILKRRSRSSYNYAFIRFAEKIGIERERAHPHVLRHSRAIHLLDSGANIILVANALGHKNIKSTLIYLRYSNRELDEALQKANEDFLIR